ncbi:MAG: hypothetical protein AB7J13_01480 [Pyrinomonadaceae bacterium]
MKVAAVLTAILCGVYVAIGQEKLRRVEQPVKFVYKNTPVEVVINLDGKPMSNWRAQAGPDWLERISLDVTNVSNKDIKWLLINLMIREPKYGAREATAQTAGIAIPFEIPYSGPDVIVIRAGEHITLKPPVSAISYWTEYARKQGIEDVEKVLLDIAQVKFTDDSHWYRGIMPF